MMDIPRTDGDEHMNHVPVDEHLAHLLLVQGGLLDAYLEQNLGKRFAYAIVAFECDEPRRVRGVTNVVHHANIRALLTDLNASCAVVDGEPIEVERSPRFLDTDS
jgi:hypothetical protein